jgi:hypothetical protein
MWPTVITNLAGFALAAALMFETELGVGSLILGPFISGACFNFWYWPWRAARSIGASWHGFMFSRPARATHQPGAVLA